MQVPSFDELQAILWALQTVSFRPWGQTLATAASVWRALRFSDVFVRGFEAAKGDGFPRTPQRPVRASSPYMPLNSTHYTNAFDLPVGEARADL